MFVCTNGDGVRTYQNSDGGRNCVPLNLNPITVVPGTQNRSATKPKSPRGSDYSYDKSNDYLTFDAKDDRLKILQEELRLEESKIKALEAEYKEGQPDRLGNEKNYQKYLDRTEMLKNEITMARENIDVLKKEIARMGQ